MLHHWAAVREEYYTIKDFLVWLEEEGHLRDGVEAVNLNFNVLLDEYLEVDREQLERERRALVNSLGESAS